MLSGVGIWSAALRYGSQEEIVEAAGELESLGFTAMWIPDAGGDVFGALDALLAATSTITVATGILNIWRQTPDATNAWWAVLGPSRRARVMLGLGVSHAPRIGEVWGAPLATMSTFLDELQVPSSHRCLAALGPKMLDLAASRTAGAHPYLGTPEHTAHAREILGPDAILAPEQGVLLETDPATARAIGREELSNYAVLPNYVNHWKRLGFTDEEIRTGSDRFVDSIIAWGDVDDIARRVDAHRAAGADHVCLQVLPGRGGMQRVAWRELAGI